MTIKPKQNWKIRPVAINALSFWDENSRFPDYLKDSDERELIQTLLKKYNLEVFVDEVVKDFDLPQLERIVVLQKGKKNIVLEGNRRLATYKCLANPDLIEDEMVRKKFEVLSQKVPINDGFKVEAVITKNKKEGLRFIERKHYLGNNEVNWGQYERDHHIKRTRQPSTEKLSEKEATSIFRANIGNMVKRTKLPEEMKRNILGRGYVTNFYRVVDSDAGRKKLKYERLNETELKFEDEKEFLDLLKVIIFNLLKKCTFGGEELNSRTLNYEKDIQKYLDSISSRDVKEVDRLIALEKKGKTGKGSKTKKQKQEKPAVGQSLSFPIPRRKKYKFNQLEAIEIVKFILERFFNVAGQLEQRHASRPTLKITDEYDVQDLLHSLLKLFFDEVYPEEWTPSYLGKSTRIDFLLKRQKVVVEVKKTSDKLRDKKLRQQLIEDTHHYNQSQDCEVLVCFIFDPDKKIKDVARIKADLERKTFTSLKAFCIVAR